MIMTDFVISSIYIKYSGEIKSIPYVTVHEEKLFMAHFNEK